MILYGSSFAFDVDSSHLRIGLRACFTALFLILAFLGDNYYRNRVKIQLMKRSNVKISMMTGSNTSDCLQATLTTVEGTNRVDVYQCSDYEFGTFWLIDTSGFNDTYRSDAEVLGDIVNWLNQAYIGKIPLTGIFLSIPFAKQKWE